MQTRYLTLGDVARQLGVAVWQIRRLYERGLLPPAQRIAAYRIISADDLPIIEAALLRAGYIDAERRLPVGKESANVR